MSDFDPDAMRISIAKDLRKVEELTLELHAQALASPNDRDFPGGTALHMLAPAASSEAWERQYARKETLERFDPVTGKDRWEGPISPITGLPTSNAHDPAIYQYESDAAAQPLNVLESWTRIVREEREQPTSLKATISRESDYLRGSMDWMLAADEFDEPAWPAVFAMADELRALVRLMEDVLTTGHRIERTRVKCTRCEARSRLEHQYLHGVRLDAFKCPDCKEPYTWAEFMRAYHQNLVDEGAEKFILATEAQQAAEIPVQTMRSWMRRLTVRTACDIKSRRLIVWWPDIREQVEARRRVAALTKATDVSA